jgi:hypothetical protein
VFGRVVDGMDVVTAIESVATDEKQRPLKLITIDDCGVIEGSAGDLVGTDKKERHIFTVESSSDSGTHAYHHTISAICMATYNTH